MALQMLLILNEYTRDCHVVLTEQELKAADMLPFLRALRVLRVMRKVALRLRKETKTVLNWIAERLNVEPMGLSANRLPGFGRTWKHENKRLCGTGPFFTVPRISGLLSAALGLSVLAGWALGIPWIKSVLPGAVAMRANTAVGLLIAGVSLCLMEGQPASRRSRMGQALALSVAVLGLATLGEYFFGWRMGIDEFLFYDSANVYHGIRGRMSPYSALAFVSIGLGLAALPRRSLRRVVWAAATLTLLIGGVSFVGYAWNASELVTGRFLSPLAVNTAAGFVLLGVGTMMAGCAPGGPTRGIWASLSSVETKTLAGFLATLFLLLVAGRQTYRAAAGAAESARWAAHSQQVRVSLGRLYGAISDAESGQRNYLLSGNQEDLEDYKRDAGEAGREAEALAQLVADNPAQRQKLKALQAVVGERMVSLERATTTYEQPGHATAKDRVASGEGRHLMAAIRTQVKQMDFAEEELLMARQAGFSRDKVKTLISLLLTVAVAMAGFMVLFSGIRREMSNRAQSEAALEYERYLLHTLMDNVPVCIYFKDLKSRFLRNNRAHAGRLGLGDPTQAAGKTDFDFFKRDHAAQAFEDEQQVIRTGQPINKEEMETWPDGRVAWALTIKLPLRDEQGQIVGTFGISHDITQRKAEENELRRQRAQLQSLFESLPGLYLVLEPDLKIVAASDAYLSATMTKREQIIGRGLFEVFPDNPKDSAANGSSNVRASLDRVLKNAAADTMGIQKYDIRRSDGSFEERFWSPINSPLLGLDRQVEYIIHRVEDVTEFVRQKSKPAGSPAELSARLEQMEAEIFQGSQKVQAANQQLEAANKELEAFSYSVSHDLRAPLRHVQGYVEMLGRATEGQLSDKARRYLKTITDASAEMGQLIDDLLAFSRMGRVEMQETRVSLDTLVRDTVRGLEMMTTGRNIAWKIGPLPQVLGDPATLKQVLANLVGNAVKYSRQRDPAEIEIGYAGEEDGHAIVFVRDNGAGFDMKYAQKLFGVFHRLHRAEEFEGTGIGLAIVRRIIDRHGGRTWAEGELNKGATFYFTLKPAATIEPMPSQAANPCFTRNAASVALSD